MFKVKAAPITDRLDDVAEISDLDGVFSNVVGVALAAAGLTLFIMLLIGGFNILTAGGNAQKAEAAQKTITWAIGGMVFMALAFLIIRLIASFTGVEGILNFTVVQP